MEVVLSAGREWGCGPREEMALQQSFLFFVFRACDLGANRGKSMGPGFNHAVAGIVGVVQRERERVLYQDRRTREVL